MISENKRVLVVSKTPSALSVIKNKIPATFKEFVVDASYSEGEGLENVRGTVEALASKIAESVNLANTTTTTTATTATTTLSSKTTTTSSTNSLSTVDTAINLVENKIIQLAIQEAKFLSSEKGIQIHEAYKTLCTQPYSYKYNTAILGLRAGDLQKSVTDVDTIISESRALQNHEFITNYNQNSIPPDPSHENWLAMFEKSKTLANKFFPKLQHGFGNLIGAIPFVGVGRKKAAQMVENFIKNEGFVLDKRGSSSGFSEFDWNVVYRFMKIEKLVHEIRRMYGGLWPGLMADDDDRDWGKLSKFMKALVVIKRSEVSGSGSGSGSDISPALEVERAMLVDKRKKLLLKHIETKTLENLAKNFSPEAQSKLIR